MKGLPCLTLLALTISPGTIKGLTGDDNVDLWFADKLVGPIAAQLSSLKELWILKDFPFYDRWIRNEDGIMLVQDDHDQRERKPVYKDWALT